MTEPIRVFVDEHPLHSAPGSSVLDVVAGDDPELAAALREGRAHVTNGVGRPVELTATVFPGAIYRLVRSARRGPAG